MMLGMMTPAERLAALLEAEATQEPFEILPFWGHRPNRDGSVGAGCLSQWWPAPFTVDGETYATAEHWMMAGKARLFGDDEALAKVMATTDPGKAKAIGRTVRGFVDKRWRENDYRIVVEGNVAKFGQHEDLRDFLIATGRRVIVEASPTDRVWGIGLAKDNSDTLVPSRWRGRNQLGFALMEVRERLVER
jgi:ribA/ribD-fused uncharacterized protein